jgi:hypothetical protein
VAHNVIVEVPIENVLINRVRHTVLRRPQIPNAAGHVQFWSPASIREFLEAACHLRIVDTHLDLIRPEAEFWGRKRLGLGKAFVKTALKRTIPAQAFKWLFTTHFTCLCRKSG